MRAMNPDPHSLSILNLDPEEGKNEEKTQNKCLETVNNCNFINIYLKKKKMGAETQLSVLRGGQLQEKFH